MSQHSKVSYVSFACSWAFAEVKKMEGNAKIIKLIARDENVHLASTQQYLNCHHKTTKTLLKRRNRRLCTELFMDAIRQEKDGQSICLKTVP